MFGNAFCNMTMHITRCTLNRSVPLILSLNHLIVTLGLAFANYVLYLREKKISMDLLRYEKKLSFLVDLSKFLKIMHCYACFVFVLFFFGIMRNMGSIPNCAILHPCIIPEA